MRTVTIEHLIKQGVQQLIDRNTTTPRLDVELLLVFVLQKERVYLYAHGDTLLDNEQITAFNDLLKRRIAGEPIAHIIGKQAFWSYEFLVSGDVLIPRPETEMLVELALSFGANQQNVQVLDLGTGSGAIGLSIALDRPNWRLLCVDASDAALQIAERNKNALHVNNATLLKSHWFSNVIPTQFDMIVSNPPYIAQNDPHLTEGDVRFEPLSALTSGVDGLDDIRSIVASAPLYLKEGGWLLIEHGWQQGEAVAALFRQYQFQSVSIKKDLSGNDRVTFGKKIKSGYNESKTCL